MLLISRIHHFFLPWKIKVPSLLTHRDPHLTQHFRCSLLAWPMVNRTMGLLWNIMTSITNACFSGTSSPKNSISNLYANPTMQLWTGNVKNHLMANVLLLSLSCIALTCSDSTALSDYFVCCFIQHSALLKLLSKQFPQREPLILEAFILQRNRVGLLQL